MFNRLGVLRGLPDPNHVAAQGAPEIIILQGIAIATRSVFTLDLIFTPAVDSLGIAGKPTSGTIKVFGKPVHFASPGDAIDSGIGMVHQHFMLVPTQSVT